MHHHLNEINLNARVNKKSDWFVLDTHADDEAEAKKIRDHRDTLYGNVFKEVATDERWVGDLGEIVLDRWFAEQGLKNTKWISDDSAGRPDFVTESGIRIGAKTVKRKAGPQINYEAGISARHLDEPTDWFFFMSYVIAKKKLWLLGAVEVPRFRTESNRVGPNGVVHGSYTIRKDHAIHNIGLDRLIPPLVWLQLINGPGQNRLSDQAPSDASGLNEHRQMPPEMRAQVAPLVARRPPIAFRPSGRSIFR